MKPRTIGQDLEFMADQLRADAHNYGLDPRGPRIIFRDRERQARTILARVPGVKSALESLKDRCITGPEKRAVAECIEVIDQLLDGMDCRYCGERGGHTADCPVIS